MTWNPILNVRVVGIPKAQPRARAFARNFGGKVSARMYDPGTAEAWKNDITMAIDLPTTPADGPIRVDIKFLFPRPKRLMRAKDDAGRILHTSKPDRDNCEKAVLDCFTTLGLWRDDGQVCAGEIEKFYAAKNEQAGAEIVVSILPAAPTRSLAEAGRDRLQLNAAESALLRKVADPNNPKGKRNRHTAPPRAAGTGGMGEAV